MPDYQWENVVSRERADCRDGILMQRRCGTRYPVSVLQCQWPPGGVTLWGDLRNKTRFMGKEAQVAGGGWAAVGLFSVSFCYWWWNKEPPSPDHRHMFPHSRHTSLVITRGATPVTSSDKPGAGCQTSLFLILNLSGEHWWAVEVWWGEEESPAPLRPAPQAACLGCGSRVRFSARHPPTTTTFWRQPVQSAQVATCPVNTADI